MKSERIADYVRNWSNADLLRSTEGNALAAALANEIVRLRAQAADLFRERDAICCDGKRCVRGARGVE